MRYFAYVEPIVCLLVFEIFNVRTDADACHYARGQNGRNIPSCTGEWNPHDDQYHYLGYGFNILYIWLPHLGGLLLKKDSGNGQMSKGCDTIGKMDRAFSSTWSHHSLTLSAVREGHLKPITTRVLTVDLVALSSFVVVSLPLLFHRVYFFCFLLALNNVQKLALKNGKKLALNNVQKWIFSLSLFW